MVIRSHPSAESSGHTETACRRSPRQAPAREHTAILRVRSGGGVGLRQHAVSVRADETGPPGWDLVTTRFADVGSFADYAASFGPDAVVLDPPDLREAVIARLKGVLA